MTKKILLAATIGLLGAWLAPLNSAQPVAAAEATSSSSATLAVVNATHAFLALPNDEQRGKAQFEFNDEAQRRRWSNFPTGLFQRTARISYPMDVSLKTYERPHSPHQAK